VGEADRLLTVLSRERGKLRLNAKGARKVGSRKSGHVELFVRSRMLIAKGRGEIDIVSQVEMIDAYRGLREDLTRSTYAHYAVELIDAFAEEGSEQSELFDLLAEMLKWIETTNNLPLTARFFEMQLLTLAGFQPQVFSCSARGEALQEIAGFPRTRLTSVSSLYLTSPIGPRQRDFLNAAVQLTTSLSPDEFMGRLQHLESGMGRPSPSLRKRWGARVIDIDILFFGRLVRPSPRLTLPHPELIRRRFVLEPLAEIAPGLVHPLLRKTVRKLKDNLILTSPGQKVTIYRRRTGPRTPSWIK
jgi:2-amino-4-hydroxy-6-hydroxymethyldihydropteridine diphosphokinase